MIQSPTLPISSDLPINGRNEDKFTFSPFAKKVVAHIFKEEQPESLVVGLSGRWGSGKTSLLNLIEEELTGITVNEKQIITLRYVPWRVEDRKSLLSNFLPLLIEKIEEEVEKSSSKSTEFSDLIQSVKKYVKALENTGPTLKAVAKILSAFGYSYVEKGLELIGDVNSALDSEKIPDIEQLHRIAYKALAELRIPIVVMIDDIDRLEPSEIVDLLRLVRATAQLPYITFIVAYDQNHVISAVEEMLNVNGEKFLEKFIQIPIAVPLVKQSMLNSLLIEYLQLLTDCIKENQDALEKQNKPISEIIDIIESTDAISTPRDVFRIVNTVNFRTNSEIEDINFETIIYLSVIQTKFPLVFEWLSNFIEKRKKELINATNVVKYNLDDVKNLVDPDLSIYSSVKKLIETTLLSFRLENS